MSEIRSAHPVIAIDPSGEARARARRCKACDARLIQPSIACTRCGRRDALEVYDVATTGTLRAFSIVHRSFPGVVTPFISAIADMADGTVLKGNLRGVAPDPNAVSLGMPIKLVIDDAGRTDREGHRYLAYFFEAA